MPQKTPPFQLALILCAGMSTACEQPQHRQVSADSTVVETPAEEKDNSQLRAFERELKDVHQRATTAFADEDLSLAKQFGDRGLKLAEKCGHKCELYKAKFFLIKGNVARENGLEIDARRFYADAMALFHVHKNDEGRFSTFLGIGALEARLGDYANAGRQFDQASALRGKVKSKQLLGDLHVAQGRLHSRQLKHEAALKSLNEALRLFDVTNNKSEKAEALFLIAKEEEALGRERQCRHNLNRALRIFRDLEDLDGEARVIHRLAALHEQNKQYKQARKLLGKVHALYVKLDRTSAAAKVERHINALPEKKKKKKK